MTPDKRDPILLAVELNARRRPGEPLSAAADRLIDVDIPDHGSPEAAAARAKLNGQVEAANEAFRTQSGI